MKVFPFLQRRENQPHINSRDIVGWTPLHLAASKTFFDGSLLSELLRNENLIIFRCDIYGNTPFSFAVEEGNSEALTLLLDSYLSRLSSLKLKYKTLADENLSWMEFLSANNFLVEGECFPDRHFWKNLSKKAKSLIDATRPKVESATQKLETAMDETELNLLQNELKNTKQELNKRYLIQLLLRNFVVNKDTLLFNK